MILSPNETKLLTHIGTSSPVQQEALLNSAGPANRHKLETLLGSISRKGLVSDNNEGGLFLSDKGEQAILQPEPPPGTFKTAHELGEDALLKNAFDNVDNADEEEPFG